MPHTVCAAYPLTPTPLTTVTSRPGLLCASTCTHHHASCTPVPAAARVRCSLHVLLLPLPYMLYALNRAPHLGDSYKESSVRRHGTARAAPQCPFCPFSLFFHACSSPDCTGPSLSPCSSHRHPTISPTRSPKALLGIP